MLLISKQGIVNIYTVSVVTRMVCHTSTHTDKISPSLMFFVCNATEESFFSLVMEDFDYIIGFEMCV